MQSGEIVKLTRKRIASILKGRRSAEPLAENHSGTERRRAPRWPFNGAVEIWPEGSGNRSTVHGACLNISETGLGLKCEQQLTVGESMEVAVHLSEMTVCGRAVVRYCAEVRGEYMVGMEFEY